VINPRLKIKPNLNQDPERSARPKKNPDSPRG